MHLKEINVFTNTSDMFVLVQGNNLVELTSDMIPLICDELARLKHALESEQEADEK